MILKKILKKILKFGIKKEYFEQKAIQKIEKNCCNDLDNVIIDFDKTKEIVCKETNQVTRKSCDGLYLKESIDFIEFKSLNNFFIEELPRALERNNKNIKESEIIKKKVSTLIPSLEKKISDSLWIFDYIIRHRNLALNNAELAKYNDIEKNYFVVKDNYEPSMTAFTIQLNLLSKNDHNSLNNRKTMDIKIENGLDELSKKISINKTKLIDCKQLKEILDNKVA